MTFDGPREPSAAERGIKIRQERERCFVCNATTGLETIFTNAQSITICVDPTACLDRAVDLDG